MDELGAAGWISDGAFCECRHQESDHETAGKECAYGWTDEPHEDMPCDCTGFRLGGHFVRRAATASAEAATLLGEPHE